MTSNGSSVLDQAYEKLRAPIDESAVDRDTLRREQRRVAIAKKTSPPGMLGLSRQLDERRIEYGMTDAVFSVQAVFDRLLVWQVPAQKGDTYEGSLIVHTEKKQAEEHYRAPIGIIVSAGLKALDTLTSNGMRLGDKILMVKNAPYYVRIDVVEGVEQNLVVLTEGEIVANYDLAHRLKQRALFLVQNPLEEHRCEHVYKDESGSFLLPVAANRGED